MTSNLTILDLEEQEELNINQILGVPIAVPKWEAILIILVCFGMIGITVVGNILVILSVLNHAPLKILSNYFVVSLAVADLTVAITVLPLNVAYLVLGRWIFGSVTCKIWLTADVLCCTASILNLCAIALDRYWAIHDPINYATKRTSGRVYCMIVLVWTVSCIICLPPLIGWNDWPDHFTPSTPCMLTEEKGYIVYSSFGSFFIPLILILFLYFKIFLTQNKMANQRRQMKTGGSKKQVEIELNQPSTSNSCHPGPHKHKEQNGNSNGLLKKSKEEKKKPRRHILALVKEKNSIMYKKSVNAGSQSGISSRGYTSNDMNGNGTDSEVTDTANVNIVMNQSESTENAEKHEEACNSVNDNSLHEDVKSCLSNSNVKLLDVKCKSLDTCVHSRMVQESSKSSSSPNTSDPSYVEKEKFESFKAKLRVQMFLRREKDAGKNQSREQKAARTMAVIVVTFIVCWLPFFTMYVILPFCPTCTVHRRVQNFITWLGYLNSTLNPIIYTIFNPYFRQAFNNILSCKK